MPPPQRTQSGDYHYHAYDYQPNPQAWTLSQAVASSGGMQFYSMQADLSALAQFATNTQQVPHVAVGRTGAQPVDDQADARDMTMLRFGGPIGGDPRSVPQVVLTGGVHAREWVAPAIVYLIAEYLILNYTAAPANRYQQAIHDLLTTRHISVIPILNPNGNHHTIFSTTAQHRNWRKNREALPATVLGWDTSLAPGGRPNWPLSNVSSTGGNIAYDAPVYRPAQGTAATTHYRFTPQQGVVGVDVNRNFSTMYWGYVPRFRGADGTGGDPTNVRQDYFGPARASETETRNLQAVFADVARAQGQFDTSIDYHSYSKLIVYPTEAWDRGLVGRRYQDLGRAMQVLIAPRMHWTGTYDYALGTPAQTVGYDATGSVIDRAAGAHGSRAYTIELDPGNTGQGPAGFELPEDQIMGVFEKNIRAALALIAAAGHASRVTQRNRPRRNHIRTSALSQFLSWNVFGRGNQLPL